MSDHHDAISGHSRCWFVYLMSLADCSGFKVGFSNNPLQRIYTFSPRYFERFDLHESLLLRLDSIDAAREVEAALKLQLAAATIECPGWVPGAAGGFTEWFGAPYFGDARERLHSFPAMPDESRVVSVAEFVRAELLRSKPAFEQWAVRQAQAVSDVLTYAPGTRQVLETARPLRDWLDACRCLDVPIFQDDAAALALVTRLSRPTAC